MADERGKPTCPETGISVPECSCRQCLEAMLRAVQPGLLDGEFRVIRIAGATSEEAGGAEREAA